MFTLIWYFTQPYWDFNKPWEEPVSTHLSNHNVTKMLNSSLLMSLELGEVWHFFAGPAFVPVGASFKNTVPTYANGILGKQNVFIQTIPGMKTPLGGDKQCHTETNVARSNFFYLFKCHVSLKSCLFWVQVAGHLGCNLVFYLSVGSWL